MLNVKNCVKSLISDIYECQKKIMINRRFIQDLLREGNESNISVLHNEIKHLQEKIREFQKELRERHNYAY